jgi:hypothetical protein
MRLLFWPQIYSQRFAEFKLGTVAWMEAQPLKDLEKANSSLCHAKCTSIN